MKKRIVHAALTAILAAFLTLGLSSCAKRDAWMPEWFTPSHTVTWKEIDARPPQSPPTAISKKEALEDLATFKYLVETSYSGYEYQRKFNHTTFFINFCRAKARVLLYKGSRIPRERFAIIVAKCLWGAHDGHFCVDLQYRPNPHEDFFRSDIAVAKRDGRLVVVDSGGTAIPVGSRYRDSAKYLFRVWSADGERYRIGTLSARPIESLALKIGKGRVRVSVATIAPPPRTSIGEPIFAVEGDVAYLRVPSFCADDGTELVTETGKKRLEEIVARIKDLSDSPAVVIDLRDNQGGYIDTASAIPAAVFGRRASDFMPEVATLSSPGIAQAKLTGLWDLGYGNDTGKLNRKALEIEADNQRANPRRYWSRAITRTESPKPIAPGKKLIIILNRRSASAAEFLCACRSVPGVTIVGENSAGAMRCGDPEPYVLRRSGIVLLIPAQIQLDFSFSAGEGTGVLPDYWASDAELESTIRGITGEADFSLPAPVQAQPAPK
jgi:hypothetical protein